MKVLVTGNYTDGLYSYDYDKTISLLKKKKMTGLLYMSRVHNANICVLKNDEIPNRTQRLLGDVLVFCENDDEHDEVVKTLSHYKAFNAPDNKCS